MGKLLLNISNHPSREWEDAQKEGWDIIVDIPFPSALLEQMEGENSVSRAGDFSVVKVLFFKTNVCLTKMRVTKWN
jgi:hypothetical protein